MELQELVERIERWKARKEGGGRELDEIIEESPAELQTSQAPDSLWQEHAAEPEDVSDMQTPEVQPEVTAESLDEVGPVAMDESVASEQSIAADDEVVAEEAQVAEAVADEVPVEEFVPEPSDALVESAPEAPEADAEPQVEEETAAEEEAEVEPLVEAEAVVDSEDTTGESTTEIAVDDFEEIKD